MAEWAVAGAETGRVSDRRLHVADAALDGLRQRQSLAEACGDGGRQRTAGAVRVLSVHTRGVEQTHLVTVEEQVDDRLALGVPALHERRAGAVSYTHLRAHETRH